MPQIYDSFTSPPKEGVLRIFHPKNPTASAGFEPAKTTEADTNIVRLGKT